MNLSRVCRGAPFPCSLTCLDLSEAMTAAVRVEEDGYWLSGGRKVDLLFTSMSCMTNLRRLLLPEVDLDRGVCDTISRVVRGLPLLTHLAVGAPEWPSLIRPPVNDLWREVAAMPHLRVLRFPVLVDLGVWPENADGDVACELARVAAEKAVEVDLCCSSSYDVEPGSFELTREFMGVVLPLCCRLCFEGDSGLLMQMVASHAEQMTALKSLHLEWHEWETWEDSQGIRSIVKQLGRLSGLRALAYTSLSPGSMQICSHFCEQVTCLQQLTDLQVAVYGSDHAFIPRLIQSCRTLPRLRTLILHLTGDTPTRRNGVVVLQPPWWPDAGPPMGWDLRELTSLHSLLVFAHGNLPNDKAFWEGLTRLSKLQTLMVQDYIDDGHLDMLKRELRGSGGMMLEELCVGTLRLGERARSRVRQLVAAAGDRVAVAVNS